MIVKKNSEALERKAFLIKSLENENITKKEYDAEIAILDPFIKKNLEEATMGILLMSIGSYIYGRVFDDKDLDIGKYITNSIIN